MRGMMRAHGVVLSGMILLGGCGSDSSDGQQPDTGSGGTVGTGGDSSAAAGASSESGGAEGLLGGTAGGIGTGGVPDTGTGGADCPAGTERCPCYGNGTCNDGLVCASDLCVDLGIGGSDGVGGGSTGAGGDTTGVGGVTTGTGGAPAAGGTGGTGGACTEFVLPVSLVPVNLVFIVDQSGSMGTGDSWDNTPLRWVPLRDGLTAFLNEPGSRRQNASLEFFPAAGSLEVACRVAQYETPAVELMPLDSITVADSPFLTAFNDTTPGGGTPTLPALLGSLNYARTLIEANPDTITVVVLFTDGPPAFSVDGQAVPGCTDPMENTVPNIATIAAQGLADGIPTYVIGIADDPDGLASLHQIAQSGGTGTATVIATGDPTATTTEIQAELARIRGHHQSCSIPAPEVQSQVDWTAATVLVTVDGIVNVLEQTPGCASGLGWQYLYSPDAPNTPSHIELCQPTCETVQGLPEAELSVDFGCVE